MSTVTVISLSICLQSWLHINFPLIVHHCVFAHASVIHIICVCPSLKTTDYNIAYYFGLDNQKL